MPSERVIIHCEKRGESLFFWACPATVGHTLSWATLLGRPGPQGQPCMAQKKPAIMLLIFNGPAGPSIYEIKIKLKINTK
jgi:hypothetical protein